MNHLTLKICLVAICFPLAFLSAQKQPNILWIVCEDISPTLSMYVDSTAKTPNLDALAKYSIIYENAFATVGVCAPSRSSIITGMHAISLGTMHMRTGKDITSHGSRTYKSSTNIKDIDGKMVIEYSAVPSDEVRCFTEYMRASGYFCTNNQKTDYQFAAPLTAWDVNSSSAHWRLRSQGTPFFSVFNINETHESKLWEHNKKPLTVDPSKVKVPPYLLNHATTRHDIARHYSNIELMDIEVGKIILELKDDGLYNETIIVFYSDHGGPLPRQKRETNDRGLKIPLMVKPIRSTTTMRDDRLVSLIDLAPTTLTMAGIDIPKHMQGISFYGPKSKSRKCILGTGDRFDEFTDRIRLVRTKDYVYIRNDFPDRPAYLDIDYRKNIPSLDSLLSYKEKGKLDDAQLSWFLPKGSEILYHVPTDRHNLVNVATDPKHRKALKKMRKLFASEYGKIVDLGKIPEAKLISTMWPRNIQPQTSKPKLVTSGEKVSVTCDTPGSSIAYVTVTDSSIPNEVPRSLAWKLYTPTIRLQPNQSYLFVAERIGYKTSEMVVVESKK